jgi:hypothetical protein
MRPYVPLVLVASFALGGCASIVNGQNQSVSVEAKTDTGPLQSASCRLINDKGTWFITTPGSTTVHRSYEDLAVYCEKDGQQPGSVSVKSSTKPMAFGNILFGGLIGVGVDVASGAAYDYPNLVTVVMGTNSAKPPPPVSPAASAPASASAPAPTSAFKSTEFTTIQGTMRGPRSN